MVDIMEQLPNRYKMFKEKGFIIYITVTFAVHLIDEIWHPLFR